MSKSVKKNTMPKAPWPHNRLMAAPYLLWSAAFIIIPLCMIFYYGLTDRSGAFTFENVTAISSPEHMKALITALVLSLISTVVCLALAYPLAMILAGRHVSQQSFIVLIFILPMWMNFLLRTYAWMSILENHGFLNQILALVGIGPLHIINTDAAVILGMVYNFLPFMILPIFSVIEKLDRRYIEAAQDLGAGRVQVFRRVIFPLSVPGVISGIMMVFIPSISTFAISKLLGGGMSFLLGDLIEMQFLGSAYNPHLGSAISLMMMLLVIVAMLIMNRFGDGEEGAVMM